MGSNAEVSAWIDDTVMLHAASCIQIDVLAPQSLSMCRLTTLMH